MNKKSSKIKWLMGAVVLMAFVAAFFYWRNSKKEKMTYREVVVARGDLGNSILATGNVKPRNRLEIKAAVAGRIDRILVNEGDRLRQGQVIAWMSSTERAAMLDAARAQGPEALKKWSELYLATPVISPIAGTLILRNVEPGQTFTTTDAIFVISDRLTVKAQVDETDIARVKIGGKAVITLDAYPNQPINAEVEKIAFDATLVNSVTTYIVDVIPVQTPEFMKSGMTANVSFSLDQKENVLVIPTEALKVEDGKSLVLVKAKDGAPPIPREITTGITAGKDLEVVSGLNEGETLLIPEFKLGNRKQNNSPFGMPARPGRGGSGGRR